MGITKQELKEDLDRILGFAAVAFVALVGVVFLSVAVIVGCGAFYVCRFLIIKE